MNVYRKNVVKLPVHGHVPSFVVVNLRLYIVYERLQISRMCRVLLTHRIRRIYAVS